MYLQTDRIVISVGGVVFATSRGMGTKFLLDVAATVGLDDGIDVRRNFTPRQIRSGDFLEHGHHAARYMSLTGVAVADSVAELHAMRDDFVSAVKFETYELMSVETAIGTRYATVSIAGKTSWVRQTDKTATFKLDLYAPDPKFYSLTKKFTIQNIPNTGGMNLPIAYPLDYGTPLSQQPLFVTNSGNVEAWPTFVVTGDYSTGFSITDNLGNYVTYTGPVSSHDPVTLNSLTGSASQGGQDRSTMLTKRDWFSIPAGTVLQPTFIPHESVIGWCDIIFRDTWI